MALDRQSIEKKDFPIGRRGYDPEAVDAHLSALADEIADLKRSARRRTDALASTASEQVRAIVEAAETSAADIQRDAEHEARDIRDEATAEAKATREQATGQAKEYVGKVSESTASMLQRLDAMEGELSALIDALRTGGNRLDADLRLLETNLAEVGEAVSPRYAFESEEDDVAEAPGAEETEGDLAPDADEPFESEDEAGLSELRSADAGSEATGDEFGEPPTQTEFGGAGAEGEAESGSASGDPSEDAEGARLIALNMALNGTPRDETARYLSENFSLADSDRLLDEVYASVEG